MDNITKKQCLDIINDIQENDMPFWDWTEDYYNTGITDKSIYIDWVNKRLDKMKELVLQSNLI